MAAHHACLPEPVVPSPDAPDPGDPVVPQWPSTVRIEHTRQRYDETHDLREHGLSMRAIARKLDLNFKTVRYADVGITHLMPMPLLCGPPWHRRW